MPTAQRWSFLRLFLIAILGLLPSLASSDTVKLRPVASDFPMIGRINYAGFKSRGHCTGTLIAADLVLTAAHCVYSKRNGESEIIPDVLIFVAGYSRGTFLASSRASEVYVHPDYAASAPRSGDRIVKDVAILRLADPITQAGRLRVSGEETADELMIAGYRGDRAEVLSLEKNCPRTGLKGIISMACEVVQGNSGGPVLSWEFGEWVISGTVSSRLGKTSFAAPVTPQLLDRIIPD